MRWLGIGEKPSEPIVGPEASDRFYEAERQNREAVLQARLSNRRLRAGSETMSAIDDLLHRLERKEQQEGEGSK